jgi:UDP-N-acetylmuramoylalanine-D-glutamate ligase
MRVLVCGGRDYSNRERVFTSLDMLNSKYPVAMVIHGAARGADSLADEWAKERGVPVERYPAQWDKHGKAAGPLRNQEMIEAKPDAVVAFPGGRGTEDMVARAKAAGVRVWQL